MPAEPYAISLTAWSRREGSRGKHAQRGRERGRWRDVDREREMPLQPWQLLRLHSSVYCAPWPSSRRESMLLTSACLCPSDRACQSGAVPDALSPIVRRREPLLVVPIERMPRRRHHPRRHQPHKLSHTIRIGALRIPPAVATRSPTAWGRASLHGTAVALACVLRCDVRVAADAAALQRST